MPRFGTRPLGIGLLLLWALLGAGCGLLPGTLATPAPPAASTPRPSPTVAGGWVEDLSFGGDFNGHMALVAPPGPNQSSECTGKASRTVGQWASTIFGQVGPEVFGLIVLSSGYRGPGSYDQGQTQVQVTSLDRGRVWASQAGDPITFTVGGDEESGTLAATLTNLANAQSKLRVSGKWSCRT